MKNKKTPKKNKTMEKFNLMKSLAEWENLAQHIGNPAWEREYRSFRKNHTDRDESGLKNFLVAKINPIVDAVLAGRILVQVDEDEDSVVKGLKGLGTLVASALPVECIERVALVVCTVCEGIRIFDYEDFFRDEKVCFADEHGVWTPGHLVQMYQTDPQGAFIKKLLRGWFANQALSEEVRKYWALSIMTTYLQRHNLWPQPRVSAPSKKKDQRSGSRRRSRTKDSR